ncbi:MAG: citrate lyase ACP [Caldilinea sp. CFX5]|nr:citrate lyase ACP [Caldilinea sp. CFX5]
MGVASAGMHGGDVRSDCWVQVEETTGRTEIQLTSRVAALYGESIRTLTRETLAMLGATNLSVTMDDSGALPYTLLARIEAAVLRLRPTTTATVLPPINPITQYPTTRHRLRRSRLYLPGNTPKFFINAGLHRPDAVILDLEDSVAATEKDAARLLVRNALRVVNFYGAEKMVRVNALPAGLDDMRLLAPHGVHVFLLPKTEKVDDVVAADRLLTELGVDCFLIPLLESAKGVLQAWSIATASPRVVALAIGLEDYTADLGAQRTAEGRESLWARSQVVNAARATGVQALSSVFANIDDQAALLAWARAERGLGFEGIGCLHPRQVAVTHQAFAPTAEEVGRAQRIMTAYTAALAAGQGVTSVDGMMIDAPVVARAERIIKAAEKP